MPPSAFKERFYNTHKMSIDRFDLDPAVDQCGYGREFDSKFGSYV